MVKLASKEYSFDEGINLLTGALQGASAVQMIAAPANYQDQCLDGTAVGRSNGLTRIAGAAMAGLGAANILAAHDGDHRSNRRMHRVNAGHYAILAGMGANKLSAGSSGLTGYKKDKLTALTAVAAGVAALHAYRGFKKDSLL